MSGVLWVRTHADTHLNWKLPLYCCAISLVRPSVCFHSIYLLMRLTFELEFVCGGRGHDHSLGHDHSSQGIEGQGDFGHCQMR